MTDKAEGMKDGQSSLNLDIDAAVHTVYFYYLRYGEDGLQSISFYHYFDEDHPIGNLEQKVEELIINANFDAQNQDPPSLGDSFDDFHRRRKGFFIVALDGAQFTTRDPIMFKCDHASIASSKNNDGRHTFFRPRQFDVPFSGRSISVASYLYWAQSYQPPRDDLDDHEWEHFHISFGGDLRGLVLDTLYNDSGGTNMGPPPAPPARRR